MRILTIVASIVLVLHGLIHIMGTAVYMQLGVIQGLPYTTTVLGGRWDLGAGGIAVYGADLPAESAAVSRAWHHTRPD